MEIEIWWVYVDGEHTAFESTQEARDYATTKIEDFFASDRGEIHVIRICSERISLKEWNELPERAYSN